MLDYTGSGSFSLPSQPPSSAFWKAPPHGFFKINVDAAASSDGRNSSIREVIRDNHGFPLVALCLLLPMPYSVEVTEALALQQGVRLAIEMNLSHTIFESDALCLVQALNSVETGGELGHILQEIRKSKFSFSSCSFRHLKREGNRVAHELAKAARSFGRSQIWKGVSPPLVQEFLMSDLPCNFAL